MECFFLPIILNKFIDLNLLKIIQTELSDYLIFAKSKFTNQCQIVKSALGLSIFIDLCL